MTETNALITQAASISKSKSFMPAFQAETSDELALGVAISKWAHWDGDKIAETFFAALEDANFHRERADFILLWNDRNGTAFH